MADISRIPSELTVGVFEDNLLATQLDTQERINSLFSDFNIPTIQHSASFIPKDLGTDDILQSRDLISRKDFLTSTDPKLNEIAKNQMLKDAQKNKALTKGYGLPSMVKYQEGQSKYTDDHWWSEAGKTKYGFNPYVTLAENDAFYHDNVWNNYSLLGKIWRGTATFAGRALSKLVTGLVGMVGDIGSMAWNGLEELNEAFGGQQNNFWADVSDNWLARKMEQADQYVKNQILPTYKSINYDNKGAFSKLFDPYFWTNDLADGAGFLLQFAIPASLLGKAAVLGKAGKLGRFGRVMSAGVGELPSASRLTKGLGSTLEFFTGSRNVGGITAHVFNTTMESVAETKEGFNNTVEELIGKGFSEHEAKQIAGEAAPFQFGVNMAILSVSNAFENKWFQTSVGNRINPFRSKIDAAGLVSPRPNNLVGKFFSNNKWGNRVYFYGSQGAKAAVMEGYWEENAQLAAQRVARGEYTRRGNDTSTEGTLEKSTNFFKQLIKQTVDATNKNDREAADSIMAGAVIGILGGGMFNTLSGSRNIPQIDNDGNPLLTSEGKRVTKKATFPEGTRKRQNREHAEMVARVRNSRDAWLSINLMPQDIYNEDGTINEEKAQLRVVELNEKLAKVASVFQRKITLNELTDQTERENKQYVLFGDYLKAHILNGSADALINRLKNWGNKSSKELEMYGVSEDMNESPIHWANVAQTLYNEYKKIDKIAFVNRNEEGKQESSESYFQKERALKSLIFDNIAQREASKATAAKYAQLEAESDPFISIDEFNSYNKLISRKLLLETIVSQENLDEDAKQHYQAELDKTDKQIDMRKNSLPSYEKGKISDMVFEEGSDVNSQERQILSLINEYLGFQFAKEDFLRSVEAHDTIIKDLSDPETGIQKWNKRVDYWDKAASRIRLSKLKDLGYTDAEIVDIPIDEQNRIIEENKKKEEPVEEKQEEKPEDNQPLSKDELRKQILALLQSIDPNTTDENLDVQARAMVDYMGRNPGQYPDELAELLTKYLQDKVDEVKGKTDIEAKKADIERRRQEDLANIGIKQKQASFEKLKEAKTPKEKLNAINLIERNVAEGAILSKKEQEEIQRIKDNLASEGYEVPNILGKQFHQGMKVIVTSSIPDETLAEGEEIITKVLAPQVNKDDKMVQTAQIEVTVGTKKGGLTRDQWLAEQKKKETRVDKINAKYDAELKALESLLSKEQTPPALSDVESTSKVLEKEGLKPTLKNNGDGEMILQVDDIKGEGKRSVGVIGLKMVEVDGKKFLSIGMTSVREGYEGKGLATNMYRYLMENLPEGYDGILSPKETRWNNEQIPKIHEKLAKEYDKTELDNGDIIFKPKLESLLSKEQTPTEDIKDKKAAIEKGRQEIIKFFETKFNLLVEYDTTLKDNIGGYVKNNKVYLNPNINPDKLEEVLIEEYTHIITTKLEREHPEIFEGLFQDLINTPEYKEIRDKAIAKVNSLYPELTKNEVEKLLNKGIENQNKVNYGLRAIDILQSNIDKVTKWYSNKNVDFWKKLQQDLQIPKEQVELLKQIHQNWLNKARLSIPTAKQQVEELIADFAANYSYTIEINTAKEQGLKNQKKGFDLTQIPETGRWVVSNFRTGIPKYFDTKENAEKYIKGDVEETPTQYHSNLTVPGGTNHTENEIAIPGQLVEERPQGISTKQGVSELFESNPELSSIGTQQQYSQYLATIFPDSKVKDIVYHGTNLNFDKFDKDRIGSNTAVKGEKPSFSFSNNRKQAEAYSSEITVGQNTNELAGVWFEENQHIFKNGDITTGVIDENNVIEHYKKELENSKEMISPTGEIDPLTNKYKLIPVNNKTLKQLAEIKTKEWQKEYNTLLTVGPKVMSVIIDVKNPKIVDFKGEKKSIKFKEEQKNTIGDAFIAKNIDDWGKGDVIQVFEPEQIHILGSKQDVEGFKKFIKDNTKSVRKNAITPSIKGHAQFSTDNGIGWFTSDDKVLKVKGWKKDNNWLDSESPIYNNAIEPTDRVIWGHPTIGKSFLKEKGDNTFITLDDDYVDEVNAFIDKHKGTRTRQEYKGAKPKEYNEFMLNLFDRLKQQAEKENKLLFVSNTNILKERMEDFDKVITIPKEEFKKRFDKRGSTYGFEDWKSDIDSTIKSVDPSKVINTIGYLSDLLQKQVKTRRILEVQSDLFQKGRDREDLSKDAWIAGTKDGYSVWEKGKGKVSKDFASEDEARTFLKNSSLNSKNQFLQLLNKNNSWVTFFVKSIIQDSAKKGYEKVLFPRLDTIIQIESAGRFKTYEEAEKYYKNEAWQKNNDEAKKKLDEARALTRKSEQWLKWVSEGNTWQTEETYKDSEFEAWKKDRVSKAYEQWHSLQPSLLNTAKFYEYELANRLDDIVGGNKNNRAKGIWALNQITDEYGNTWNEVEITLKIKEALILLSKLTGEIDESKTQLPSKITQSFKHEVLGQATAMATKGKVSSGLSKITNNILKWIKDILSKIGFKNINYIKTFKDLKQVFEDNNIKINAKYDAELKELEKRKSKPAETTALEAVEVSPYVQKSLLEEARKAYNLHRQALENDTSFKEEAEKEGMRIHNNKIDNHVDNGKNKGDINIITSNPRDLLKGSLNIDNNNLARFNFLDNVMSGKLDKNDFKMVLSLSEKGTIFGLVGDKNGVVQLFNDKGIPVKGNGMPIFFYLDYDMFETKNMSKRRMEVVEPPFAVAPLTSTPIELHRSFVDKDVIEMLKDRIKRTTVTASFSFLTQGLLFRDGVKNTYASIPKNEPSESASQLIEKGHIWGKGEIPLEDMVLNGVYRRAHRIQFHLMKDLNDKNSGTEVAEFHPVTIGEMVNENGQKIWDLLKNEQGDNLFEAAIKGNLESTQENLQTLSSLLRPDKFLVLNLGSNILIINLKKFKKFVTSDNVTPEQLKSLTTIEDIKNSELNFTKSYYDNDEEIQMLSGVLGEGRDNYARFIHNNVKTSAKPLKKGNIEGYARINKRIALTLDENIEDMTKAINQKEQENKAPEITEVKIEEEFSDNQKASFIFREAPEEENFDDDFTKTDCR